MKSLSLVAVLAAAVFSSMPAPAVAGAYDVVPTRLRLSYEDLRISDGETMGLIGGSYLVKVKGPVEAGMSIFGAAKGERGGFFTGGASLALYQPLSGRLHLDAGLFVGAGGGGSAPQGGGLMLRARAGLSLALDGVTLGLGYGTVDFPNGDITSDQVVVSISHPFSMLAGGGWNRGGDVDVTEAVPDTHLLAQGQRFESFLTLARPAAGTVNTTGTVQDGDMALIGVAWERDLSDRTFLELSVAGSMGGASDGFAQGFCDLGSRVILSPSLDFSFGAGLGLAGGGRVDTGGGLVADAFARLEQSLGRGYYIDAGAGVVGAIDGEFVATRLHAGLGYAFETPVPTGGWRVPGSQVYGVRSLRLSLLQQSERAADGALRKDGSPDKDLGLAGLKGDIMISRTLYLTGQAQAAYDGGAGGYAVGLAGIGGAWPHPDRSPWAFGVETMVGAAGGGGIVVDGGLIAQATAGVGYRHSDGGDLWLRYGRSGPVKASLERSVLSLEVGFRFSTLMR